MARARLHVICGNCGCNDSFEYKHEEYPADNEELTMRYETTLTCKNCSTIHWLNDNADNKNTIRDKAI
jgi:RNase P subunit RPR2